MVENHLKELTRPSKEFPRNFVPDDLDLSKWENLEPLFKNLLDRKLDSKEALEQWLLDSSELSAVVSEEVSRRYIAKDCATDNPELEKAFLHFVTDIAPKVKPFDSKLDRKFIECPYLNELDQTRYEVYIRDCRKDIELFREENIPVQVEIEKLSQEYNKIFGAMTVNYKGKEYPIPQMAVFLQQKDREIRFETFKLTAERKLEDAEKLDELFDKMLKLRVQVAKNAGFDNFVDYQFRSWGRFDYTPEDCLIFHNAVEKHVLPLTLKMAEDRKQGLKIDPLRPWDTGCDRYGRDPLKPFKTAEELVSGCREVFGKVDTELGYNFQKMIDLGLLDLDSRKGKVPAGGYQVPLAEVRLPFILMNAVGIHFDVNTLIHEGGHAFHNFAARDETIHGYRQAPLEFCEVASMSMELLSTPYLEAFYSPGDAARARRGHFEQTIGSLPMIAMGDAFQHWIYTHPEHTSKERSDYWISLGKRFGRGIDWTGFEEAHRFSWHGIMHFFAIPFYFIEYGIAQLGALQMWQNSRKDKKKAIEAYKSALKLGGSRPLPELFKAANIKFDFSDNIIQPLIAEVTEEVKRQGKLESR
ncbi:MAG: M3 family oligoendopeptidase [Candidatus Hatepunaea meridiana]|nr:M3 family oligoendopeptidase [Candidatus Hatepunaea meridiana]